MKRDINTKCNICGMPEGVPCVYVTELNHLENLTEEQALCLAFNPTPDGWEVPNHDNKVVR